MAAPEKLPVGHWLNVLIDQHDSDYNDGEGVQGWLNATIKAETQPGAWTVVVTYSPRWENGPLHPRRRETYLVQAMETTEE